jgi:hypothetical protein
MMGSTKYKKNHSFLVPQPCFAPKALVDIVLFFKENIYHVIKLSIDPTDAWNRFQAYCKTKNNASRLMLKDKFNQIRLFHIIFIKYVRNSSEQVMIGLQVLEVEMVECMLNSLPSSCDPIY